MKIDWVSIFQPLTQGAGWYWTLDGKVKPRAMVQPSETPWIHAPTGVPGMREANLDCGLLHIYHNQVFHRKSVHSFCMDCYKVVVMPETLEQVVKIAKWQAVNGLPGKVGAEKREYVNRKWGAYFYCRGLEDGQERYKLVRKWVDENLGPEVKVILKRGCTEFEQNLGDSDKWELIPNQKEIEDKAASLLEYEAVPPIQSAEIKDHAFEFWKDWENKNRPPVTYHQNEKLEE